jgi:hypothetical protein
VVHERAGTQSEGSKGGGRYAAEASFECGFWPTSTLHTQAVVAPVLQYILEPLREAGCFQGVNCSRDVTLGLLRADGVVSAHMTGSTAAHDFLVWGPPEVRAPTLLTYYRLSGSGRELDQRAWTTNAAQMLPVEAFCRLCRVQ